MKTLKLLLGISLLGVSVALFTGCETTQIEYQAFVATFLPSEYAGFQLNGSGTISGQAFLRKSGGGVVFGAGKPVVLMPVTDYTTEMVEMGLRREIPMDGDPGYYDMLIKVQADGEGRFTFENVPAGDYWIFCWVRWSVYYPNDQGGAVWKKVSVFEGETSQAILTWD